MKKIFYLSLSLLLISVSISLLYYFFIFLPTQKNELLELEAIKISGETAQREAYEQAVINCRNQLIQKLKNGEYSIIDVNLSNAENQDNWMTVCMPNYGYSWD